MGCGTLFRNSLTAGALASLLGAAAVLAQPDAIGRAFEAARNGDRARIATLQVTQADLPALAEYLRDPDEAVRQEAIVLIAALGRSGCAPLAGGLTDASADLRERAARALHHNCPPEVTASIAGLADALRKSSELGNTAAAVLLLLGRFQDAKTRDHLASLFTDKTPVKLEPWNPPVPRRLAASVGGVSAGVPGAADMLAQGLGPINEAEFLALTLGDIHSAGALRPLLELLDDERTVATGVPSGAQPRRRICDLAVDSFVRRLNLQGGFPPRTADRYRAEEIGRTRDLAAAAIGTN